MKTFKFTQPVGTHTPNAATGSSKKSRKNKQ